MSDLIERDKILGACIEKAHKAHRYKVGEIWELNYYEIREAIESIPTAEPMSDLISREETIARFVGAMRSREKSEHPMPLTEERIVRFLKAMPPTAEPKVGKWIPFKWYFNAHHDSWTDEVKCSECGEMGEDDYNYCPYCGAKMERSE